MHKGIFVNTSHTSPDLLLFFQSMMIISVWYVYIKTREIVTISPEHLSPSWGHPWGAPVSQKNPLGCQLGCHHSRQSRRKYFNIVEAKRNKGRESWKNQSGYKKNLRKVVQKKGIIWTSCAQKYGDSVRNLEPSKGAVEHSQVHLARLEIQAVDSWATMRLLP